MHATAQSSESAACSAESLTSEPVAHVTHISTPPRSVQVPQSHHQPPSQQHNEQLQPGHVAVDHPPIQPSNLSSSASHHPHYHQHSGSNQETLPTISQPSLIQVADHFQSVDHSHLTAMLAEMFTRLTAHNDQIPLTQSNLTRFHSRAAPQISIVDYLKRIVKYASVERVCLLILLVYIDRVCKRNSGFTISSLTVHRFIITGVAIGSKALCDSFLQNSMYAKVGGISTKELNILELEFLFLIDWDLAASRELLQQYYLNLVKQTAGYYIPGLAPEPIGSDPIRHNQHNDPPFTTVSGAVGNMVTGAVNSGVIGGGTAAGEGPMVGVVTAAGEGPMVGVVTAAV